MYYGILRYAVRPPRTIPKYNILLTSAERVGPYKTGISPVKRVPGWDRRRCCINKTRGVTGQHWSPTNREPSTLHCNYVGGTTRPTVWRRASGANIIFWYVLYTIEIHSGFSSLHVSLWWDNLVVVNRVPTCCTLGYIYFGFFFFFFYYPSKSLFLFYDALERAIVIIIISIIVSEITTTLVILLSRDFHFSCLRFITYVLNFFVIFHQVFNTVHKS